MASHRPIENALSWMSYDVIKVGRGLTEMFGDEKCLEFGRGNSRVPVILGSHGDQKSFHCSVRAAALESRVNPSGAWSPQGCVAFTSLGFVLAPKYFQSQILC